MDLYTIYETEELKVSIPTVIHDFLKLKIKKLHLDKNQFYILLSSTLAILKKQGEVFENKKIKSSAEIPVIESNKPLSLYEPFDIFEQGFNILSCAEDKDSLQSCIEGVEEVYGLDEHLYFHIFSKALFNIHGFFALIKENEVLIAFFALAELED